MYHLLLWDWISMSISMSVSPVTASLCGKQHLSSESSYVPVTDNLSQFSNYLMLSTCQLVFTGFFFFCVFGWNSNLFWKFRLNWNDSCNLSKPVSRYLIFWKYPMSTFNFLLLTASCYRVRSTQEAVFIEPCLISFKNMMCLWNIMPQLGSSRSR